MRRRLLYACVVVGGIASASVPVLPQGRTATVIPGEADRVGASSSGSLQPSVRQQRYRDYAEVLERGTGIHLIRAVCAVESSWEAGAVGAADERGLCQLRVSTVQVMCPKGQCPLGLRNLKHLERELFDPYVNMWYAANYFVWLRNELRTTDPMILAAAYNAGPRGKSVQYMLKVEREMHRED